MNRLLAADRSDQELQPTWLEELVEGNATFAVSFAGQGAPAIDELATIYEDNPSLRWLFSLTEQVITEELGSEDMRWSGLYAHGLDLRRWMTEPESRPDAEYLVQSHISHPIVFLSQLCRYLLLLEHGLERALPALKVLTGHSQGVITALLLSESGGQVPDEARIRHALVYILWQGFWSQQGRPSYAGEGICMVAISGPRECELKDLIAAAERRLPPEHRLYISLQNTATRAVVSSTPEALEVLRTLMERRRDKEQEARKAGKFGGRPLTFRWDALAVGSPFHCPHLRGIHERMHTTARERGLNFGPLKIPVYDANGEGRFTEGPELVHRLIDGQFLQCVQWSRTLRRMATDMDPDLLIDCGPGDGVAKLAISGLRGTGVSVVAAATTAGQESLFTAGAARPRALNWNDYSPKLTRLEDGQVVLETRYTRLTGQSPMILAGMTPTTVEVPICAAAANAGFTAELAGGGQVTEELFELRMEELAQALEPGAGVVFNALLLDPWLFGLHLGDKALVQRAVSRGVPIRGVTMSGGVPEVAQGVDLLNQLNALGIDHNAFKPGTVAQVDAVLKIAAAAPEHLVFVHLEGGRAGGHHSWEDLDELLLLTYARLRAAPNVVLCVGGGIADPGRAADLLTGRWAVAHGELPMPVDALLLGTVTMAVKEATASPAVKAALMGAKGTEAWVCAGDAEGGVTSGRSGLNADIHYLENAAAQCGRLLDSVAGDAEAVEARRDEIIAALNATAKPYFGDVAAMTYGQVLDRMVELMAVGRHGRYEDGPWPDVSYRQRVLDVIRRAEARCAEGESGEVEAFVSSAAELDEPEALLARLRDARAIDTVQVHPADAVWFVRGVCARRGKPVNFVPVIDSDVRRWYASDSLWQAQDPRYRADQVLVLPGPAGVAGIDRVDEPVAELLARFEQGVVQELEDAGTTPVDREWRGCGDVAELDEAWEGLVHIGNHHDEGTTWCDLVADHFSGPLAGLFRAQWVWLGDLRIPNPVRVVLLAHNECRLEVNHDHGMLQAARWIDHRTGETAEITGGETVTVRIGTLELTLTGTWRSEGWAFILDGGDYEQSLRAFYGQTLLGETLPVVERFASVERTNAIGERRAQAHASLVGSETVLPDLGFSAAWHALLGAQATESFGADMLRLVHLQHEITLHTSADRLTGEVTSVANLVGVADASTGRTLEVQVEIRDAQGPVASLAERFFVRGAYAPAEERRLRHTESLELDEAGAAFLTEMSWLDGELTAGRCEVDVEIHHVRGERTWAEGRIGGHVVSLDEVSDAERHPVLVAFDLLRDARITDVARRTLAKDTVTAPSELRTFSEVGGDFNPIHTQSAIARLAGFEGPIVHGMWTSAALQALVARSVGPVERWSAQFVGMVLPGESVELTLVRTGVAGGAVVLEATATVMREERAVPVVRATAEIKQPRTAVVFPGQGIQKRGMGMESYAASRAVRSVWDRADAHTRDKLGFSILTVVRDNPTQMRVGASTFRHPEGVLHLTRFTQVAMAVLASAQTAELREAGVLGDDLLFAGHSIGEYNALCALAEVLTLETVVEVVYHRGATMEELVPRDAEGRSPYGMAAVRPLMAGLNEDGLRELVAAVAERAGFLEIVNFNIRDLQYAIAGEVRALGMLEAAIVARIPEGGKPAWTMVPGIDVPFHSTRLREGVPAFRELLQRVLPERFDADKLLGRYIPNLVARPFAVDAEFVAEMVRVTGDSSIERVLDMPADERVRTLVVELLAWQFASPVRWIETQERMFGEMGVQRLLEVGVGYQPTVRNMARHTLRGWRGIAPRVELLNVDADAEAVYFRDTDPAPVIEEEPEVEAVEAGAVEVVAAVPKRAAAASITDVAMDVDSALHVLLALQTGLRPDQLRADETIDELCDGASAKRNQVLMDMGAEFSVGTIDAAHERPLAELAGELRTRCGSYRAPGTFLAASMQDHFRRGGLSRRDVESRLENTWKLPEGLRMHTLLQLTLDLRDGDSIRGGALGSGLTGEAAIEGAVERVASRLGVSLTVAAEPEGGAADPAALRELRDELMGEEGVLMAPFRAVAEQLGHTVGAPATGLPANDEDAERLRILDAEVGADAATWLRPVFDGRKHVVFDDAWSLARRDVALLAQGEDIDPVRLARFSDDADVVSTARWFAEQCPEHRETLLAIASGSLAPVAPDHALPELPESLRLTLGDALDFTGRTALVTGASPGAIATETVRHLLAGGARVIVTTSRMSRQRVAFYRELYRRSAGPGAELHVVPFNQASRQDVDALLDWIFDRVTEQAGAAVRVLKEAFAPDLLVPFAASGDIATLDQIDARSEVSLRTLLLGVERLVAGVASRYVERGLLPTPCQVLLPMSPNHGTFGGDGLYGECKAGLEALMNRWRSERAAWGRAVHLSAATIGWVRGTGLMAGNDVVAQAVEDNTGARTFSSEEMGWLLAGVCAMAQPLETVDLSGGLGGVELSDVVGKEREALQAQERLDRALRTLRDTHQQRVGGTSPLPPVTLLPRVETPAVVDTDRHHAVDLSKTVVIVGMGELGPCGTARTRHALEVGETLTTAAVLELAWITGLIRYDAHAGGGSWIDADSGAVVEEHTIVETYEEAVRSRVGVRFLDEATLGVDPDARPVLQTVRLDRDFRFEVGSEEEARSFLRADPEHTRVDHRDGAWFVVRTAGAELRMPRATRLSRRIGGMLPTGMDLSRWGIPAEMQASTDRLSLYNLVATVDAFSSAGLTPEELLRHVHPAMVGNTQGTGLGGVTSMRRMYTDQLLDEARQGDVLQEALGNVVAAWVVQSYVGSYGCMTHPVAACATAAVSIESGVDKILAGKVEFVVAGGFDDLGVEGTVGFGDMHATAETDEMLAMGLEPDQMSRSNDARRRGFVESHGGGTMLLARGDVAQRLGLPVRAVVGYAASYSDGVHTSIPAPGRGLLACVRGGKASPMGRALDTWGLTADDIGVVYKHDTSTAANDPNEAELHHRIQEALGRTRGNPLWVVSQKTLTGHAKGGAAAWQLAGLAQAMESGVVPPNRNLQCLDGTMRKFHHLVHTDQIVRPGPMRAGLVTSLGFGHVNAIILLLHPEAFAAALSPEERAQWREAAAAREAKAEETRWAVWMGQQAAFVKRTERPQVEDEIAMLVDA